MNSIKNKFLSTEIAFVICSIFFGVLLLILTPPMQSADEQYHFTRAYSIANGHIKALKSGNTMGNFLPEGFQEFANSYSELYTNKNAHTSFEEIRKTENIKQAPEISSSAISLTWRFILRLLIFRRQQESRLLRFLQAQSYGCLSVQRFLC